MSSSLADLQHAPVSTLSLPGAVRVLLDARASPDVADKPMDETPLMEELLLQPKWAAGGVFQEIYPLVSPNTAGTSHVNGGFM